MRQINIGVLGYGNIGSAVVELIKKNHDEIKRKTGLSLKIAKIADPKKKQPYSAENILNDPSIDLVVEAIGGVMPAYKYILKALNRKKRVVTSNKEVIALKGPKIFAAAKKNNVPILMEGAVGGAIPILQALRESLNSNRINEVWGIVNGTTNYILSKMTREKTDFAKALSEAQARGFAEANPKKDIAGNDAAYKAAILAMTAFGEIVDFSQVYFEGIAKITAKDIAYAEEMGYVIKLLAIAKKIDRQIEVRVHPTLIPLDHALAAVNGAMNAICVRGDAAGELMFYGQGAGGAPTASAVVNDIIQIGRNRIGGIHELPQSKVKSIEEITSRYYLNMAVTDRPGVLAQISKVFAEEKVSIQSVLQKESSGKVAPLIITLHEVKEKCFSRALSRIKKLPVVYRIDNMIRVGL